jgi:hypothetical protein
VGVEPVHPGGGLPLDLVAAGPGALAVDELDLVEADGRLRQRVVQGVADGADGAGDAGLEQGLGERQRRVLLPRSVWKTTLATASRPPRTATAIASAA